MGKMLLKPSRAVSHRCVVCMCDGGGGGGGGGGGM